MKTYASSVTFTKCIAIAVLAFCFLETAAFAETIDGFVTRIDSPTEFNVGTFHVVLNEKTNCRIRKTAFAAPPPHGESRDPSTTRLGPVLWGDVHAISCNMKSAAIYSRVHVEGKIRPSDGSLVAGKIIVYDIDPNHRRLEDGVVLEEAPDLSGSKQQGGEKIWMDGYPVTITPQTILTREPDDTKFRFRFHFTRIMAHAELRSEHFPPLSPATMPRENTCVLFHANRTPSGAIIATKLQFWPNWVDTDEKRYNGNFIMAVRQPDYSKMTPGIIQFKGAKPIVMLPSKTIQEFVSNLGLTLVPAYQKQLPESDETKVHFHFYAVHAFPARLGAYFVEANGVMPEYQVLHWGWHSNASYSKPSMHDYVHTIVAAPDGTILIPDVMLAGLQNEAQLATLISSAITSVLQKQGYRAWPRHLYPVMDVELWNLGSWQSEQALRIGIRQMYLAGYDIREAPFAWAVAQGKPVNNPVINSKHPDKEIPWYAAYAFNYISQYYKDVDYSKLKRGRKEYQKFLKELYKADPSLPAPKMQE
jgi:hypothetical protein